MCCYHLAHSNLAILDTSCKYNQHNLHLLKSQIFLPSRKLRECWFQKSSFTSGNQIDMRLLTLGKRDAENSYHRLWDLEPWIGSDTNSSNNKDEAKPRQKKVSTSNAYSQNQEKPEDRRETSDSRINISWVYWSDLVSSARDSLQGLWW